MKTQPLDDLEMFELLRLAYPEEFPDDENETWEAAQEFIDELSGWENMADLLGRIVMLTMPMKSELTKRLWHCLGEVIINDGNIKMISAVQRELKPPEE